MTKDISALAKSALRDGFPVGSATPRVARASHARLIAAGHAGLDRKQARPGTSRAGTHLLIDIWGGSRLDELGHIEDTMRAAVDVCGATLLHLHLHHFTPNFGVTGVAVLSESHISIHTWPEYGYAALDIFMCGAAEPARAIPVLSDAFTPDRLEVDTIYRGDGLPAGATS